jgi:hypothetical protein
MFFSRIYGSEFCGMVVVVVVSTSICIGISLLTCATGEFNLEEVNASS